MIITIHRIMNDAVIGFRFFFFLDVLDFNFLMRHVNVDERN